MFADKLVDFLERISLSEPEMAADTIIFGFPASLLGISVPTESWPAPAVFSDPGELPAVSLELFDDKEYPAVAPVPGIPGMVYVHLLSGGGAYIHFDREGQPSPVSFVPVGRASIAYRCGVNPSALPMLAHEPEGSEWLDGDMIYSTV